MFQKYTVTAYQHYCYLLHATSLCTSREEAMLNSVEIKPVAITIIELPLFEGICQSVNQSVSQLVSWSVSQLVTVSQSVS